MKDKELNGEDFARIAAQLVTKWAGNGWLIVSEEARDVIESDVERALLAAVGRAHRAARNAYRKRLAADGGEPCE